MYTWVSAPRRALLTCLRKRAQVVGTCVRRDVKPKLGLGILGGTCRIGAYQGDGTHGTLRIKRIRNVQFEWDSRKAASNMRKHGVAFASATTVFADPLARIFPDPDHSAVEERELIVGYGAAGILLIVSFAERGDNVRLIGARRATAQETHAHEKHIKRSRA